MSIITLDRVVGNSYTWGPKTRKSKYDRFLIAIQKMIIFLSRYEVIDGNDSEKISCKDEDGERKMSRLGPKSSCKWIISHYLLPRKKTILGTN